VISKAATVDEFLRGLPESDRDVLQKIRALFLDAGGSVAESMKFRMPTYLIGEEIVGAFNKQKNYLCLYLNPEALTPFRKDLGALDCGKSCIRFRKPADLPLGLAKKMIRAAVKLARA
jgi:uncharacterized protein YdhG (YjbR/CyaY superfamily)